jgi:DNA modification methylase
MRTRSEVIVSLRLINELKLNSRNPRLHSRRQIRQIAASIEAFGFNVPVLIDPGGNVIAGHGRILAVQLLGWSEVPTICIAHLNETQLRAFTIADNRLSEISLWDERLLADQLKELSVLELDFNLEATGFTMGEIDLRIESPSASSEDAEDPADAMPTVLSGPPVTRLGDIWLLGRHRVGCGNALEVSAYAALMQGELATMIFTDPPYNVPIEGHVSGLGSVHHREFVMGTGEMDEAQFIEFLTQACTLLARHSIDGSLHFICMDWRHLAELLAAGRVAYSELKSLCVWVKSNGGMGSLYRSRHELVCVFKRGHAPHRNNVQLGEYGRNRTNVWNYPGISSFGRAGEEGNLLALHPTVKPIALVADAMLDCTARGDIVLDAFLGSGSSIVAAERTGRRCCGLELDPFYVDVIIRRWQAFTGDNARHAVSGRTFNELETGAGQ